MHQALNCSRISLGSRSPATCNPACSGLSNLTYLPTRKRGSEALPSLARRVSMQQHAELPCRGNTHDPHVERVRYLDNRTRPPETLEPDRSPSVCGDLGTGGFASHDGTRRRLDLRSWFLFYAGTFSRNRQQQIAKELPGWYRRPALLQQTFTIVDTPSFTPPGRLDGLKPYGRNPSNHMG